MDHILDLWPVFAVTTTFATWWTFYIEPKNSTGPR